MSLDERQEVVLKTFTREELEKMNVEDVVKLVGEAGHGAKFHGKGVVKRADGSIRYAPEATPGDFGETAEELQVHAERKTTIEAFSEEHDVDSGTNMKKPS